MHVCRRRKTHAHHRAGRAVAKRNAVALQGFARWVSRAAAAFLFGAAALSAAPAAGQTAPNAERYLVQFEGVWLGFIGLGELTLDAYAGPETYRITTVLQSGGLAALFDRTQMWGVSSGAITPAGPALASYVLDHTYAAKRRVTQIRASPTGGVEALVTPAHRVGGEPGVTQAERDLARDPLSAVLALGLNVGAQRACAGAVTVFDGKLHYRLSLTPGGFQARHVQGGYDGPALKCALKLDPISGYDRDERREAAAWPRAEIWFGLMAGSRFAPPVHARIPFTLGDVSLTLRGFVRPQVMVDAPP